MAGIYIHIPFCKQKCNYCNFHFSTQLQSKEKFIVALLQEIKLRKNEIPKEIDTLYFGGGTPSLLHEKEWYRIFKTLESNFIFKENIEITIEANPDDISNDLLKALQYLNINRLSIGTQSFFEEDLVFMNRAHTANQAQDCIKRAQDFGFENITIDLIYGSPTTTNNRWISNLQKVQELSIPHFSSYALTVEPNTKLAHDIKVGNTPNINDDKQFEQFLILQEFCKNNAFIQYEISNFGKENHFSKHNTSYWKGVPYLGLGPSAHSYNGSNLRRFNIANNIKYIQLLEQNKIAFSEELLAENEIFNETIMIGLRTIFGVSLATLKNTFSEEIITEFEKRIKPFLEDKSIILKNETLFLQPSHYFKADGIASDLFII